MRADLKRFPYRDFFYPRACASSPAGGVWVPTAATFRVEEIPLYAFSGDGEHAVMRVEKRSLTTREVAQGVARRLALPTAAVGYAGMKDKACTSVQCFTVLGVPETAAAEAFRAEGCSVLATSRHRNKLRLGHLTGNRFQVHLAGADPEGVRGVLLELEQAGVPNYYGPQRFGRKGDNALQGLAVLQGKRRVGRWQRDLLVSSLQAFVFNEVLARRVETHTLGAALPGDVLRKESSGGLFASADPVQDGRRVAEFEVSPTGPMHGKKMVRPQGEAAANERSVLSALGLDEALFARETGSRRPLRCRVEGWAVAEDDSGVSLQFSLPAGAFASAVVREITG